MCIWTQVPHNSTQQQAVLLSCNSEPIHLFEFCMGQENIFWGVTMGHLWVDIQDADFPRVHHLMDWVDFCAIQIAVIFSVFQETSIFNVCLHFTPGHEEVHLALLLVHFRLSGRICGHSQLLWELGLAQCFTDALFSSCTHKVWWFHSDEARTPVVYSSGCDDPLPELQSAPESSSGMGEPSPPPHRSEAHACQTLRKQTLVWISPMLL